MRAALAMVLSLALLVLLGMAIGLMVLSVTLPRQRVLTIVPSDPSTLTVEAPHSALDDLQPALGAEVVQPSWGVAR